MTGQVVAVSRSPSHSFSKPLEMSIRLLTGFGVQLDRFQQGFMQAVLNRGLGGTLIRKAGVMSIVETGGEIYVGDPTAVELPSGPRLGPQPV